MSHEQPPETLASTALRHARRVVVAVVGGTVLLVGIAMLVLPGPAFVVIPAGLGILAAEFAWARHWLKVVKERARQAVESVSNGGAGSNDS